MGLIFSWVAVQSGGVSGGGHGFYFLCGRGAVMVGGCNFFGSL